MRKDSMGVKGTQIYVLRDKAGNVKKLWNENFLGKFIRTILGLDLQFFLFGKFANSLEIHNLVTTAGKGLGTAILGGVGSPAAVTYLAVGIGTTAPAAANTTLESEITDSGLARAAATVTQQTTTTTNDTLQLLKTFTASGSKAVTECGAFNAASAGSMLGRQTFSAINVVSGDSLQITYKFQLT